MQMGVVLPTTWATAWALTLSASPLPIMCAKKDGIARVTVTSTPVLASITAAVMESFTRCRGSESRLHNRSCGRRGT